MASCDLTTRLLGLSLRNPIVLASGVLGTSAELLARVARSGAGAVTAKSAGPIPREGHPNPIAVDWETARVGSPEEEFGHLGSLLLHGEANAIDALFTAYLNEMADQGIRLERTPLERASYKQALISQIELAPWLMGRYLAVREDPSFARWLAWARGALPKTLGSIARALQSGELYGLSQS